MRDEKLKTWQTWAMRCLLAIGPLNLVIGVAYGSMSNFFIGVVGMISALIYLEHKSRTSRITPTQ